MSSVEVGAPSVLFTSVSRTLHRFSVSGMFQHAVVPNCCGFGLGVCRWVLNVGGGTRGNYSLQAESEQAKLSNKSSPPPCPCPSASAHLQPSLQSGTFITKTDGTWLGI